MNESPLSMCARRQMLLAGLLVSLPTFATSGPLDDMSIVNRYVAAWNAHDPEAAVSLLAPDAVYFNASVGADQKAKEAVTATLHGLIGILPDMKWRLIGEPVASPSGVSFEWEVTGSPTSAGNVQTKLLQIRGASFFRVAGGRISYLADYYDSNGMRRQLDP